MGRLSPAMLAAVRGVTTPPVVPVASIFWPSATGHYSSESFLYFEPRVGEGGFDTVTTAVSERPSDLSAQTPSIQLLDPDGDIMRILEGPREVRRSRVIFRIAHPDLAEADWFTFFDGIVDGWSAQSGVVTLNCRTDEKALRGFCPKVSLLNGSIPGLIEQSRGIYAPIIYGIHDDQSLGGKGAVKCIPVDATTSPTANKMWIVGLGALSSVPRVYKNGTLKTVSTHYTVSVKVWGGATYTVATMGGSAVETSVVGDEITCDVEGLTDVGTGGGGVITSAPLQLRHFLTNFVWGDWRTGAWLATPSVIDGDSFVSTATFLARFGSEGSIYVGGSTKQTRCSEVLNGWLGSQPMVRARWSASGSLGLRVINHASGDYTSAPWIQYERDELAPLQYESSTSQLVSRISLSYLPGQREGKLWQSLELQDLALWQEEKVTEQLTLDYSAARFQ